MSEKKSIGTKMFWYTNVVVIPKFVTIVTTLDENGIVNAAPYSLGTPYNVSKKNPQLLMGMRKSGHSYKNAVATGEFVVNFPSSKYLQQVMDTAQFMPREVNELEHTDLTPIPSRMVKPPSIRECFQHIECKTSGVLELDMGQSFVIGDVVDIVVDEKMLAMDRRERIVYGDPPVYLGDERRRSFFFGKIGDIEAHEFTMPEKMERRKRPRTGMPWDDAAIERLQQVPVFVQETVIEMVEGEAKTQGLDHVTFALYKAIEDEYAPKDIDRDHS